MLILDGLRSKCKTLVLSVSLLMALVNVSNAQDAQEHIHAADAVLQQSFTENIKTEQATLIMSTPSKTLEFSLRNNNRLLANTFNISDNVSIFRGQLVGAKNSWARFTKTDEHITGAFFDGTDLFIVTDYNQVAHSLSNNSVNGLQQLQSHADQKVHLIINAADIENTGTCALHDDQLTSDNANKQFSYNNYVNDLRELVDAQATKQIKISLLADVEFASSSNNAVAEMLNHLNIVDGIFSEQVGVQLELAEAKALSNNGNLTSTNALSLLSALRTNELENFGVRHLFTNKNLEGSTVGIAYVGSLCRNASVGITQKLGSKTSIIFAHELGHNFGSPHDNQSHSACASTGSGFIMNPNINSAGNTFSSCSVTQMKPVIEYATTGYKSCITELTRQAPSITSNANVNVIAGNEYQYDENNTVEADGSGSFTYSLDIAPTGMIIDVNGVISWTPSASDEGSNTVQIRVANNVGSDVQIFDIVVTTEQRRQGDYIDFTKVNLSSYGRSQDISGSAVVGDSPYELVLTGNTWKSIPLNYTITPDTVIKFDFKSNIEGEIHGIAFDKDAVHGGPGTFSFFGSQRYGKSPVRYNSLGTTQTITIPVGEFITGNFPILGFIMDNDANKRGVDSIFSNILIYENTGENNQPGPEPKTINIDELQVQSHLPREQDISGMFENIEQGKGIRLEGNAWKKVILESTSITPATILKFDFKVDDVSEIHGLGFFEGDYIAPSRTIQLAGTQPYGLRNFEYTGNGEWQSFVIPIGRYLTSRQVELVFILDNDLNKRSDSNFRNIEFIEP